MYKEHSIIIFVLPSVENIQNICMNDCMKILPASLERHISHKSVADSSDSEISHIIVSPKF